MTLEPKPSGSSVTLGGTTLSELDLLKINTAYECEVLQPPEPTPPEFLSPNGPIYKFPDSNECIKIEGGDGNGVGVKGEDHGPT